MRQQALRYTRVVVPLVVLFYFFPIITVVFAVCGLVDIGRHRKITGALAQNYFTGNGLATWLLSPLNLFFDLISYRAPYVMSLDDFPADARQEIKSVLDAFRDNRDSIVECARSQMRNSERGILFFRWYDKDTDVAVPAFDRDLFHVKTIGISVFKGGQSTSRIFGPLRLTVCVLADLTEPEGDDLLIEVGGAEHVWHGNLPFVFDDTLEHRCVNEAEQERYCAIVDVLRPSAYPGLQNAMATVIRVVVVNAGGIFRRNRALPK